MSSIAFSALKLQPLHFKTLAAGAAGWGRITASKYPDPLGFNRSALSRFGDPRDSAATDKFGIIYFGINFETCFTEMLIRDKLTEREAVILSPAEINELIYVPIELQQELRLLNLTHGNFLLLHIHSDILRGSSHIESRKLALEIYNHAEKFDGILYESRFTSDENIALFDRALPKIKAGKRIPLPKAPDFGYCVKKYCLRVTKTEV